jgi:hypothetical protein
MSCISFVTGFSKDIPKERSHLGSQKDSGSTALRSQGPRSDRKSSEGYGYHDVPRGVAAHCVGYSRTRHVEKEAGIRPSGNTVSGAP